MILWEKMVRDLPCSEKDIIQIQQWFKSISGAVTLAHSSYLVSQIDTPPSLSTPEALDEPNLETWVGAISDGPESWVHIPPEGAKHSQL